jgi:glycerate kinase
LSVRIVVAPDKFRGALDAASAAAAIAKGVRDAAADAEIVVQPVGDGGEGTGTILAQWCRAQKRSAVALDPLGRPRTARWWFDAKTRRGIVEMAEASGLALLRPDERDPLRATSFGTGQLLKAAVDAGSDCVWLCAGGSATVDGGSGCLQALGFRFFDAAGRELASPVPGGLLERVAEIRAPDCVIWRGTLEVLCDVRSPLLGPAGAARMFGPQKGAAPADVDRLESALKSWAGVLKRCFAAALDAIPGAGAAGGLPAGLAAAAGATLVSGAEFVVARVLPGTVFERCRLCLTGEGRVDEQTLMGKATAEVARAAGEAGVPTIALVGAAQPPAGRTIRELAISLGLREIMIVSDPAAPLEAALARTAENLRRAARDCIRRHLERPASRPPL